VDRPIENRSQRTKVEDHCMPFLPQLSRVLSRPRRRARRWKATIEVLEIRSLLTSAAVIEWSMLPQIARDPNHGNEPDLPNTAAYVNPPNGYGVQLDGSHSVGIQSATTFSWTVTNSQGQSIPLSGQNPTVDLQQGPYTVTLTATGLVGASGPISTTTDIQVKDILIVSIGDSYASGEGNPVVPSPIDPEWAYSPDPAMNTENADAHRSTLAGPAQFALELQEQNPQEAVTFVSVADSGASIPVGVLGPMPSVGDPNVMLPAQINELQQIIGSRHIDVLTVSVGADDIGFSGLAEDLIDNTYGGSPTRAAILRRFRTRLSELPQHFAELAQAITALDPGQVLVTDYPDLALNQHGKVAPILGPLDIPLISKKDATLASQKIIPPLDATITTATQTYHWTLVKGVYDDFRTHGYPSTSPWIVSLGQSLALQGDIDGIFHPNAAGQLDYAKNLLATYLGTTGQSG
jgi:hypothetical protein